MNEKLSESVRLDSTETVVVDTEYHWRPMSTCPRGCKLQLKGKGGVAIYAQYNGTDDFWVGWAPLPTTKKE
jgi:hypothetical protein